MERGLSLKRLIVLLCADIDIFLLQEEDQKTDNDKTYTKEEIRSQLVQSSNKIVSMLRAFGVDIDEPI